MHTVRGSVLYKWWKLGRANYAHWAYGKPGEVLEIIGVTGTDGKTSTCTIIDHCLRNLWYNTMIIGTNGAKINGEDIPGIQKMTSYDPIDLQKLLAMAVGEWVTHVVLEVSSHGLDQNRFEWVVFRAAVLTNISEEHLDYHRTMKEYAEAKMKLFEKLKLAGRKAIAVFPQDDAYGRKWEKKFQFKIEITYGLSASSKLTVKKIDMHPESTSCQVHRSANSEPMTLPLIWEFNLRNTLAAMSVCLWLGHNIHDVINAMEWYQHASGRQAYTNLDGTHCYVDFAHTAKWLEAMLTTLKQIKGDSPWKVICVFWAPGKRDKAKRPEMAKIVNKHSDVVIVTDDDASSENRRDIIDGVMKGIDRQLWENYYVIPKRRDAIKLAVEIAQPWDYLLLAGKWHEKVLVTNFGYEKWDDEAVLKEERAKKGMEIVVSKE